MLVCDTWGYDNAATTLESKRFPSRVGVHSRDTSVHIHNAVLKVVIPLVCTSRMSVISIGKIVIFQCNRWETRTAVHSLGFGQSRRPAFSRGRSG